ncbi:MAG TPA: TIGR04053 family radical SAM/SPASM domain-containing protein [Acidimicrobiales bacterium]|nr:TIGR04053 family radical SAM/SPASM domain-containing protein [Acidimicrobiales bacterium]
MGEHVEVNIKRSELVPEAPLRDARFDQRPLLVFWEMTKACDLACRHCRASAQREPALDELTLEEGLALIDELASLGAPRPILILTGGDCLKRRDLLIVLDYAAKKRVPVALAPSVTPLLNVAAMELLREHGVRSVSLSLDGAIAATHEGVRGVPDHFESTIHSLKMLKRLGFTVQVNTTVMRHNVEELSAIAALLVDLEIDVWEVFFVVTTGRASSDYELNPEEIGDVCEFLVDASRYGMTVRTVEAPYFRRAVKNRALNGVTDEASKYLEAMRAELVARLGEPTRAVRAPSVATRDGKGIIFVSSTGDVFASGFLPLSLGNVRQDGLVSIYRDHPLLREIRAGSFRGGCESCGDVDLCGGSRARAYATLGDPLASDPSCPYLAHADSMLLVTSSS